MKRKLRGNKKGMSIVISTIIIVAISITMAIAISFWAMGIGNSFTKFEKIEYVSAYASDSTVSYPVTYVGSNGRLVTTTIAAYQITVVVKNTGTNTATFDNVFLDGKPYSATNTRVTVPNPAPGAQNPIAYQAGIVSVSLQTGQSLTGYVYLPYGGLWNSGDYVSLVLETSAGRQYPYTVVIP